MRYLSDEWLRRADELLAELTPVPAPVVVGMHVRSGPEGPRRYHLILGPDRVGIGLGLGASAVQLTLEWAVATAIAQGRGSAQRAFLDGELQLGGDASVLLGHQRALAEIDDRLGALRAETTFA